MRAEDRFRLKSDQADNATTGNTYTDSAPGFDIVNVKVLCKDEDGAYSATGFQPLIADEVGVEAQIANIQMYVTYYVGTNVWGADNWPAGQTVTKPMVPVAENPLVYSIVCGLPIWAGIRFSNSRRPSIIRHGISR